MQVKVCIAMCAVKVAIGNSWYKTITPEENHGLCLDAPGGNAYNGNPLWLWECNGMDSQHWVFDNYQIRYGGDENFCIDAGDMSDGVQLMLWECNGMAQQTWSYDSDAMRVYIEGSATCLDLWEDQQWNGQALHVWQCNGQGNQQWDLWDAPDPSPSPSPPGPSPGGDDCLCVFDIDRTLTGKQGDTQKCPANSIQSGVYDDAYDKGDLTLSELAQRVAETFCNGCHLGIVSAGDASGDGSAERNVLHDRLALADSGLPNEWSHGCNVHSPLVTSCQDGQKQNAVRGIIDWYAQNAGAQIADSNVHFFDDRKENIEPFRNLGYNARQISCGLRDKGGSIGYCGADLSEIISDPGVATCGDTLLSSSDSYTEYTSKTAYAGHGGDEIDSDATAPAGLTVPSCEDRCSSDAACSCVSFRPSDGKCWKRGNCVPSLFGSDGNFNTYVKGDGPSPGPPTGTVDVTTLHWNIHRPCGTSNSGCISLAKQRLAALANEVGAKVVGAVELKGAPDALPGWQSSGVQCDNSAVMVAPGWSIIKSGGYCMNGDKNKGFAVSLVTPPEQVQGCSALCIVMGHVPHGSGGGTTGRSEIASVCGDAAGSCSIMMADWNTDSIGSTWSALFGGGPALVEPNEITCCYPDYEYRYDHTATNVQGSISAGYKVFDPQLTEFPSQNEHKPVSVQLRLPGGSFASSEPWYVV